MIINQKINIVKKISTAKTSLSIPKVFVFVFLFLFRNSKFHNLKDDYYFLLWIFIIKRTKITATLLLVRNVIYMYYLISDLYNTPS